MTTPSALVVGRRYKVTHRSDTQKVDRYSIMDYLDGNANSIFFSARPVAGTQEMPRDWILKIESVSQDTQIVLNERV